MVHSQEFKDVQEYAGKRVVVVGFSNTGGDIAVDLVGKASKVSLSHRAGARITKRTPTGHVPHELEMSRRKWFGALALGDLFPDVGLRYVQKSLENEMLKENPFIRPEWGLLPAPSLNNSVPLVNNYILDRFEDGSVTSKPHVSHLSAPNIVNFTDGTSVEADAIVLCTGYMADYSMLAPEADPTTFPMPAWDNSPHMNGLKYPRLYQGVFNTRYPTSLAIIGAYRGHSFASFNNADLTSTAVAQVFAGNYKLPPQAEIEKWCDENLAFNLYRMKTGRIPKAALPMGKQERWLNEAAGNGVNEKLGWGWEGWKFWWNDRALYNLLVDGVDSPHIYRLFEGRKADGARKQWAGAREQIEKLNEKVRCAHLGEEGKN